MKKSAQEIFDLYRIPLTNAIKASLTPASSEKVSNLLQKLQYHYSFRNEQGKEVNPHLPGKLIRPTLFLLTVEALKKQGIDDVLPIALGIEHIHNFSLIHDDIEDRDEERHLRKTLWTLANVAQGINFGDGLYTIAYQEILKASHTHSLNVIIEILQDITSTCRKLIDGQDSDMQFEKRKDVTVNEYLDMISGKTGAMIELSILLAARICGIEGEQIQLFKEFGFALGRAFQLQDDFFGIWGVTETTGKSTKSDIKNRKKTYPVVWALAKVHDPTIKNSLEKQKILSFYESTQPVSNKEADMMKQILKKFGAEEATRDEVYIYQHHAKKTLKEMNIPDDLQTDYATIIDFFATRDH